MPIDFNSTAPAHLIPVIANEEGFADVAPAIIVEKLKTDGIVLLRGAHSATESEYLSLTAWFGKSILLPAFLVPSKCSGFPEIARVANFADGSEVVDVNYKFGSYWHHDGDFWPAGDNHVINLLHSKVVPQSGGKTGFLDTQAAYLSLSDELKIALEDLVVTVDPKNIEDFRNVSSEDMPGFGFEVHHRVVQTDENGVKSLYVPYFEGVVRSGGMEFVYDDLLALIDQPRFKWLHDWQEGDILIWDNFKFMHRAMGQTVGKRLLWRTQAKAAF